MAGPYHLVLSTHEGRLVVDVRDEAQRPLMAFVMVLSYSRYLFLRFYLGAAMPYFIRGHVDAFAWFAARGARAGDVTIAANAVLLHFFEVAAYLIDGFAYASEALVGQSVGAKNRARFNRAIRLTTLWALVVGTICSAIIWFAGPWFIDLMTVNPEVRETARHYLFWAALTPLLGTICFQFDGIFTGAMATRDMRNMMVLSLMIYLASWWVLERNFGNHGLWAALSVFFIARGVTYAMRMPALSQVAFSS